MRLHGMDAELPPGAKPLDTSGIHFLPGSGPIVPLAEVGGEEELSADSFGVRTTCKNHQVGWLQHNVGSYNGANAGITLTGLTFNFTDNCTNGDVTAWEGVPVACNPGCSVYLQAGWRVFPETPSRGRWFCEHRVEGQTSLWTHATEHGNNKRSLFWSSLATDGYWRSYADNNQLQCAAMGGFSYTPYSGQYMTEINYATSAKMTDGPFKFDSLQYKCGTYDWCSISEAAAEYQPDQNSICSVGKGAGAPAANTVWVGQGQTCTSDGSIWTIT